MNNENNLQPVAQIGDKYRKEPLLPLGEIAPTRIALDDEQIDEQRRDIKQFKDELDSLRGRATYRPNGAENVYAGWDAGNLALSLTRDDQHSIQVGRFDDCLSLTDEQILKLKTTVGHRQVIVRQYAGGMAAGLSSQPHGWEGMTTRQRMDWVDTWANKLGVTNGLTKYAYADIIGQIDRRPRAILNFENETRQLYQMMAKGQIPEGYSIKDGSLIAPQSLQDAAIREIAKGDKTGGAMEYLTTLKISVGVIQERELENAKPRETVEDLDCGG